MDEDDWKKIRANWKDLVRNINPDDVKDHLFQEGVLTEEEHDQLSLLAYPRQEMVRKMLKSLQNKKKGFEILIEALDADYNYLARELRETDPSVVPTLDEVDSDKVHKEKMDILQQQLNEQTKLIIESRKELWELREKVKENSEEYQTLNYKYHDLISNMGLTEEQTSDMLMTSKQLAPDVPDYHTRPVPPPVDFTETVSRTLGKDIVQYMVTRECSDVPNIYAKSMRRLVKEVTKRHGEHFKVFMQNLYIEDIYGFQTLKNIADEIFSEGENNWGRIVVLYAFGSWVAKSMYESDNNTEAVEAIGDFLGMYVAKYLSPWIKTEGGWDKFLKFADSEKEKDSSGFWKGIFLTVVGFGALATVAVATR